MQLMQPQTYSQLAIRFIKPKPLPLQQYSDRERRGERTSLQLLESMQSSTNSGSPTAIAPAMHADSRRMPPQFQMQFQLISGERAAVLLR